MEFSFSFKIDKDFIQSIESSITRLIRLILWSEFL